MYVLLFYVSNVPSRAHTHTHTHRCSWRKYFRRALVFMQSAIRGVRERVQQKVKARANERSEQIRDYLSHSRRFSSDLCTCVWHTIHQYIRPILLHIFAVTRFFISHVVTPHTRTHKHCTVGTCAAYPHSIYNS